MLCISGAGWLVEEEGLEPSPTGLARPAAHHISPKVQAKEVKETFASEQGK